MPQPIPTSGASCFSNVQHAPLPYLNPNKSNHINRVQKNHGKAQLAPLRDYTHPPFNPCRIPSSLTR